MVSYTFNTSFWDTEADQLGLLSEFQDSQDKIKDPVSKKEKM